MNFLKNIFKTEQSLPTYEESKKFDYTFKDIKEPLLKGQNGDLPSYEQVMFEEKQKQELIKRHKEQLLKNLAPELIEDGEPRGTCSRCKMNVYKSWKKNPDGVLFHKICFQEYFKNMNNRLKENGF